ncbi:MAG: hypothetical protein ACRYFZ_03080 [Janthinobacterium lividum]
MRMHSLRLALVAATLATTGLAAQAAHAQDAPAQNRPRGGQRGDMYKDLNLSDDQKSKLDALMKEERANGGGRQGQQGPPSDADRKAMETRRADMDAKVKGILTPEQYTKYQTQRAQRGQGRGQRPAQEQ